MAWIYAPEVASGPLPSRQSASAEPCATSSETPTASGFCSAGCSPATCCPPPSGTTCVASTGDPGVDAWISSLEAFPASPTASPGSEAETPMSVIFGPTSSGCFARYDPESRSWRTSQASLLTEEGWQEWSASWPRSGLMRSGRCYRLRGLERRTGGNGSGSWPTPETPHGGQGLPADPVVRGNSVYTQDGRKVQVGLRVMAQGLWPTPTGSPNNNRNTKAKPCELDGTHGWSLASAAMTWPTPTVNDSKNNPGPSQYDRSPALNTVIGGQLNPTWVEWLMGWPLAWTDCEHSAMVGCLTYRCTLRAAYNAGLGGAVGATEEAPGDDAR